jgi:hypothetical protein
MGVGPPSTRAQRREQDEEQKDSATADAGFVLLEKGIETRKRFIMRRVGW